MRRIAKTTGASIVTTLADMEGNETFDPEVLGEAEEVRAIYVVLSFCGHCTVTRGEHRRRADNKGEPSTNSH